MKHLFKLLLGSVPFFFQQAAAQQLLARPLRTDAVIAVITDEEVAASPSFRQYCQMLESKEALGVYAVAAQWKDPDQVRNTLMDIRKIYPGLEGMVLIGNVPVAMIRNAQHMTTAFKMDEIKFDRKQSSVASDRFYDDVDLKFRAIGQDDKNPLWFYYELDESSLQSIRSDLYSGRIMSHASGATRVQEISRFLDKAVAARNTKNPLDQMLAFTGGAYNSESITSWMHEQYALQESLPPVFRNAKGYRALHFSMDQKMKYRLFSEIQRPGLDLTIFTEHGDIEKQYINNPPSGDDMDFSVSFIQQYLRSSLRRAAQKGQDSEQAVTAMIKKYGVPREWFEGAFDNDSLRIADSIFAASGNIYSSELANVKPASRIVIFNACYNGSFHHPDNISAAYLFGDGQTLVTHGNTTNVLQDKWTIEHIGLLGRGARAGQWSRIINTLESSLNGDPTYHFDHAQSASINKMLSATQSKEYWKKQLAQKDIVWQMVAMRRLFEANAKEYAPVLRKIYDTASSRNMRMEALRLLSLTGDANYLAVAGDALNDPYELVRRKSAEWIAKAGHDQFIPQLLDLLIAFPDDARTNWTASRALSVLNSDELLKQIEAKKAAFSFEYNNQELYEELQKLAASGKRDAAETLNGILNKNTTEQARIQKVRLLRNMYYHQLIPQLLPVMADATEPVELRKNIVEALGWFSNSYNKGLIIDACRKLSASNDTPEILKAEAIQTIGRLQSWILP
ncbi:HEAT repeat domain-containing protein [Pseudobacter ginsenosidimutans]|uniref:HEAT repeat protein n=1 Tax=Pseudobacter ginsenosidimutans TaxID=661488 RepID=A0A4Q7ME77_9BACT|nr:HEAT repeat domain-containing protein [Pseudobacter ginsenosidimutans]QEC42807.1 HEAT repeat domain-containing protein [Pseudobacter ginsenosidimutans]RZS65032.1 hypothetical protein EV199_5786 [Pseudobacter ginsenosidimutans]